MNPMQKQVEEFHKKYDVGRPGIPTIPDAKTKKLRIKLMREELKELGDAIQRNDMVEIADGIADLLVVTFGTAVAYGLDMEPIFDEVHRTNMNKLWPDGKVHRNEHGKVIKPPNWKKPDLKKIIDRQIP